MARVSVFDGGTLVWHSPKKPVSPVMQFDHETRASVLTLVHKSVTTGQETVLSTRIRSEIIDACVHYFHSCLPTNSPNAAAARQSNTLKTTFTKAHKKSLCSTRFSVSIENVENVVKAPSRPITIPARHGMAHYVADPSRTTGGQTTVTTLTPRSVLAIWRVVAFAVNGANRAPGTLVPPGQAKRVLKPQEESNSQCHVELGTETSVLDDRALGHYSRYRQ